MTTTLNIDAIESRIDAKRGEYVASFRIHDGMVAAIPGRADLRTMDDRRDAAAQVTVDATDDQARVADELVSAARDATAWAREYLDSGDESGLDGMTDDELRRVMDRAIMRGKHDRALGAARLLEASGDHTALSRLSAQNEDVRAAMAYLDTYADPAAVLNDVNIAVTTVRLPDDARIAPTREVAKRIADEDAAARADDEAARKELHDRMNRPRSVGVVRSDESRQRVRRAPFGYGG